MPRLKRFDEAVDDHQVGFGRRLHEEGLVEFVEDPEDLAAALDTTENDAGAIELRPDRRLVTELRDFVRQHSRDRPNSADS